MLVLTIPTTPLACSLSVYESCVCLRGCVSVCLCVKCDFLSAIFYISHTCVILLDLCYGFPRVREYMNIIVCVSNVLLASTYYVFQNSSMFNVQMVK